MDARRWQAAAASPQAARVAWPIVVVAALTTFVGCAPGALQLRDGSVSTCADAVRGTGHDLLGWISIAPLDRWVRAADQIGTHAELVAPGSSVRATLAGLLRSAARDAGMADAAWYDWTRPVHLLMQAGGAEARSDAGSDAGPDASLSVLAPVLDRDAFLAAAARITADADRGAAAAIRPLGRHSSVQIAWPHPSSLLAADSGERLIAAASIARCAQELRPHELLHVGVVVDAAVAQAGDQIRSALDRVGARLAAPGVVHASWIAHRATLQRILDGARSIEARLAAQGDDVALDVDIAARPGTELAASFGRVGAAGPSPLLERLPASTWWFAAQATDRASARTTFDALLAAWRQQAQQRDAADDSRVVDALDGLVRAVIDNVGAHVALAAHLDDALPVAMTMLVSTKDAAAMLTAVKTKGLALASAVALAADDRDERPDQGLQAAVASGSWQGLLTWLSSRLQGTVASLRWASSDVEGLRCETLHVDIDPAAFLPGGVSMGGPGSMRTVVGRMVGDGLEFGLCAGPDALIATFGHDAVALARSAARPGRSDPLTARPWYRAAFPDAGLSTQMALQPAPFVQVSRAAMPKLRAWPEAASLHFGCIPAKDRLSCRLGLPAAAIAQVVHASRSRANAR